MSWWDFVEKHLTKSAKQQIAGAVFPGFLKYMTSDINMDDDVAPDGDFVKALIYSIATNPARFKLALDVLTMHPQGYEKIREYMIDKRSPMVHTAIFERFPRESRLEIDESPSTAKETQSVRKRRKIVQLKEPQQP